MQDLRPHALLAGACGFWCVPLAVHFSGASLRCQLAAADRPLICHIWPLQAAQKMHAARKRLVGNCYEVLFNHVVDRWVMVAGA